MYLRLVDANPAQLTWTAIFVILGSLAAIVLVFWAIGKLIPSSRKYSSAGGNALMRAETFLRPSREHVLEAKEQELREDEQSGDPPRVD